MKNSLSKKKPSNKPEKRDFWRRQIEGWKKSMLSQSDYCLKNRLSLSTFHCWNARLKAEKVPKQTSFLRVQVPPRNESPSEKAPVIQVRLPNGIIINLPMALGLEGLAKLIQGFGGSDVKAAP